MTKYAHLSGARALVVILGVHGGGVANAKWLLRQGAKVTVTDMRTRRELAASLARFSPSERRKIRFVLGGQHEEDFRKNDLIVLGPGVQKYSPWRGLAFSIGKRVETDASLFLRFARHPIIAVTGTRGKTTTTGWIAALLSRRFPDARASGNTPENALLQEIDRRSQLGTPHVVELSSWQLELAPLAGRSPRIAVVTNLYPDHLNTYDGMEDYADAKANIFAHQGEDDVLILNHRNTWSEYFLTKRPRSRVVYFSAKSLPREKEGIFVRDGHAWVREGKNEHRLVRVERFIDRFGEHNLENLLAAMLAVVAYDPTWVFRERDILALSAPRMRQEIVVESGGMRMVNDSTSTSPDGTIAALRRFSRDSKVFLIAGGTDKELIFADMARIIKYHVPPERLTLIDGTATTKLVRELLRIGYRVPQPKESFEECVEEAFARVMTAQGARTLLFSPGAASFGKFLHEFDRGERFNALIARMMKAFSCRFAKPSK